LHNLQKYKIEIKYYNGNNKDNIQMFVGNYIKKIIFNQSKIITMIKIILIK
jgi:hypothetical protein